MADGGGPRAGAAVLVVRRWTPWVHADSLAVQEQLARLSSKVQENLNGMAVVRAYTMEPREIEAFARLNREHLARTLRLARRQAAFSPFLGILAGLGTLLVLWFGGKAVVDGRITLGALVAFSGYLGVPRLADPGAGLGAGGRPARPRRHGAHRRAAPRRAGRRTSAAGADADGPPALGEVGITGLTFGYGQDARPRRRCVT